MLYCVKYQPRPSRRSYERFEDMSNSLIQANRSSSIPRICFFAAVLALLLGVTGWERCEAQQIPRRIDTSTYQNRGPTPPLLAPRGPLFIQPGVSPYTNERLKTYYRPSAQQLGIAPPPYLPESAGRYTPKWTRPEKVPDPYLPEPGGYTPSWKRQ